MKLNKNTNVENFNFITDYIHKKYNFLEKSNIRSIFIKELPNADLLLVNKDGASGKTTHIACTGDSRQFFADFISNSLLDESVETFYDDNRHDYKFKIYIEAKYINGQNNFLESHCALWINQKKDDDNQIGLSKDKYDDESFKQLRKCMFKDDILVFFKYIDPNTFKLDYFLMLIKDDECEYITNNIGTLKNKPKYAEIELDNSSLPDNCISNEPSEYIEENIKPCDNLGFNKIFYGCPGVGKSFNIDETFNSNLFRTTFHPEYTYYDFIGSVRPQIDYSFNPPITNYQFLPGDFTKALKYAIDNSNEVVNFVIEELNRANTSAVFGDIFQLLDRDDNGFSKYYITNENIATLIYKDTNSTYIKDWLNIDIAKHQVKLPNNFNIIASMNTSDQNVNALDSAFTRRWDMEYVPIDFNKLDEAIIIDGLNISWSMFASKINEKILASGMMNAEDKQMGPFFAKKSTLQNSNLFSNKVLVYLWKDVFKVNKSIIFNTDNIKGISSLITTYLNDPFNVFNPNFLEELNT